MGGAPPASVAAGNPVGQLYSGVSVVPLESWISYQNRNWLPVILTPVGSVAVTTAAGSMGTRIRMAHESQVAPVQNTSTRVSFFSQVGSGGGAPSTSAQPGPVLEKNFPDQAEVACVPPSTVVPVNCWRVSRKTLPSLVGGLKKPTYRRSSPPVRSTFTNQDSTRNFWVPTVSTSARKRA
jgi:hypothetical protein